MFKGIDRIGIPVTSVSDALSWYAKALDAVPSPYADSFLGTFTVPGIEGIEFNVMHVSERQRLRFTSFDRRHVYCVVTFYVSFVSRLYNTLVQRGVNVGPLESGEDGVEGFWFEDPDGNQFEVSRVHDAVGDVPD